MIINNNKYNNNNKNNNVNPIQLQLPLAEPAND